MISEKRVKILKKTLSERVKWNTKEIIEIINTLETKETKIIEMEKSESIFDGVTSLQELNLNRRL